MGESVRDRDEPRRVLVVQADPGARSSLLRAFDQAGFSCESAGDGVEAMGWVVASPFHAIVTEVELPRLDGPALFGRLQELALCRGMKRVLLADPERPCPEGVALADSVLPLGTEPRTVVAETLMLTSDVSSTDTTKLVDVTLPEPDAPAEAGDLKGDLRSIHPAELVRMMHAGRRSAHLEVVTGKPGERRGDVLVQDGELVAAHVEEQGKVVAKGELALAEIFDWSTGDFSLEVGEAARKKKPISRNIARPTPRVIREAEDDEAERPAVLGPFEVIETLAEGTGIAVHRVRRTESPRAGDVSRLVVEGRPREPRDLEPILALEVPGVARLLATGVLADGRIWYESELIHAPTLEEVVRDQGPLAPEAALEMLDGLFDSLARAHERGVPHQGLDARRILLPPGERPVLLDHGVLRRVGGPADRAAVRTLPPEGWRGRSLDALSDLYSCGVLGFFALSGRYPFEDENPLLLCRMHLHAFPPRLGTLGIDVAPEVEEVLLRLLAKTPAERFPTAEGARAALEPSRLRAAARAAPPPESWDTPAPAGYRFLRRIGTGGAGDVYQAYHETLEKLFAVKVVDPDREVTPEARERFLREARLAASIDDPGVVRIVDAKEEEGRLYLIMELVAGESLKARLAREGALEEEEAVAIARAVLSVLALAHERGIVHRDIKPDNILLGAEGRPKVADFGMARSLVAPDDITRHGHILGTPLYMSPEQCEGVPADARSDLYSLGATLHHMLAGRPPFGGETIVSILRKHVETPAPPLTGLVSPEVAATVARLLEKDPAARFQSAREALLALPDVPSDAFRAGCTNFLRV